MPPFTIVVFRQCLICLMGWDSHEWSLQINLAKGNYFQLHLALFIIINFLLLLSTHISFIPSTFFLLLIHPPPLFCNFYYMTVHDGVKLNVRLFSLVTRISRSTRTMNITYALLLIYRVVIFTTMTMMSGGGGRKMVWNQQQVF